MDSDRPGAIFAGCVCPKALHRHGTYVCRVVHDCRCAECRGANNRYEARRKAWTGEFPTEPPPLVDSGRAREHLLRLIAGGMSEKRIREVMGFGGSTYSKIVYGRNDRANLRIRRAVEERILAIELDVADGRGVDGTEGFAIISELLARGWSKRQIAKRIGSETAEALQTGRNGQTMAAGKLRKLRGLMNEPVPLRWSGAGKRFFDPSKDHEWQAVALSTPGVPGDGDLGQVTPDRGWALPDHLLDELRRGLRDALRLAKERDARHLPGRF